MPAHVTTSVLVDADGTHLHALAWEPVDPDPDLPSFLLVHGLSSNAQLWAGVGAVLAGRGHRVVAVDQRGHGLSAKVDGGDAFGTLTDDLVAVMDALDLDRPVVVGQSWGGNVALELAAHHGDRVAALVAVDGGHIDLSAQFPDKATMLDGADPAPPGGPAAGGRRSRPARAAIRTGPRPASAGSWRTSSAAPTAP